MHNISNLRADLIQQQKTTPGESKNSKLRLHTFIIESAQQEAAWFYEARFLFQQSDGWVRLNNMKALNHPALYH